MKAKKIKIVLLITGTVLLWSNILYYLYSNITTPVENSIKELKFPNSISSIQSINPDSVLGLNINRDPFSLTTSKAPIQKTQPPAKTLKKEFAFNYKVNGVIINNYEKLVLIEDQGTHQIYFLREGDEFNFLTIKIITKNLVEVLEDNNPKQIKL
jgi:hypothetical protein